MSHPPTPVLYGMRANVLRSWNPKGLDPSRVISGDPEVQQVFVVGDGVPPSYPVRPDAPLVLIGETSPGRVVARPANPCPPDRNGYMASGAYICQSGCFDDWNTVFGHALPIPLHDYAEPQKCN